MDTKNFYMETTLPKGGKPQLVLTGFLKLHYNQNNS